jgi:phage terminase large subunit
MSVAAERIALWRHEPWTFAREACGFIPDSGWQEEFFRVLADPTKPRIAAQSCKGPGKTACIAVGGLWFFSTHAEKGNHPKGAAISVSSSNLRNNLWGELAKWRNKSPFLREAFEWTASRIYAKAYPEDWFLSANSWSQSASAVEQTNALSGLHGDYALVLMDESGGIPASVLAEASAALSTAKVGKIIQTGNPTQLSGALYHAVHKERSRWHLIRISGDPDDPNRATRVNLDWARGEIEAHGRDNPWVKVNVFGEFPESSFNSLLGPDDVRKATLQNYVETAYDWAQPRLGVDVARFGDDRTVLFFRQGLRLGPFHIMRNARTNEIASRVALAVQRTGAEQVFIDGIGIGAGVVDACLQARLPVVDVQSAGKPTDPKFFNKRAEMGYTAAEWVKRGGWVPKHAELEEEMTAPTYCLKNGRILIEAKEQLKQRLGKSPDLWDAACLTFATPDQPRFDPMRTLSVRIGGGRSSDWDPINKPGPDYDPMERGV